MKGIRETEVLGNYQEKKRKSTQLVNVWNYSAGLIWQVFLDLGVDRSQKQKSVYVE